MLHQWEEPCISGEHGTGTVFFSGCSLGCVYCQNRKISRGACGEILGDSELEREILVLCDKGAAAIEFVTPTHYALRLASLLSRIKHKIPIPTVYNSGGYDSAESLRALDGLIDIYMPDFKYFSPNLAKKYSNAEDYPAVALSALREMVRQTGAPKFASDQAPTASIDKRRPASVGEGSPLPNQYLPNPTASIDDLQTVGAVIDRPTSLSEKLLRGTILRHLILPSHRQDSIQILNLVAEEIGVENVILSLLGQYTPDFYLEYEKEHGKNDDLKALRRRITSFEYNSVLSAADRLGFRGYMQDLTSSTAKYTPEF